MATDTEKRKTNSRKKKSLLRRIRHWVKRHRWVVPAACVVLIVMIGAAILIISDLQNQDSMQLSGADTNVGSGYRDVVFQGKRYRYNNRITAILFAGVDSEGELEAYSTYTMAPRADSIELILLDERNQKMRIVALSRDTMTKIRKYALDGMYRGLFRDHLGLAYTYGDGGKVSCESLREAVSMLLYDVPIRDYLVVNRSSMETLAGIVGPVEVTVPNDDLAELDEAYYTGATVTIDADNLEFYIRSRDIEEDLSNVGRMERQQSYITAAMDQFLQKINNNASSVWDDLETIEGCMQTNITRSRYLDLVKTLQSVTFSAEDYLIPEGTQKVGEKYDEFYPDEEALLAMVVDLFYIEQ